MTQSNVLCIRTNTKIVTITKEEQDPVISHYSSISKAKRAMRAAFKAGYAVEVVSSKQQNPAKQPAPEYVKNGKKFPRKQEQLASSMRQIAKNAAVEIAYR